MHSLIRSKGFIWLSNSHMQIFYWALAGRHFELKQYATWPAQRVTCRLAAATSQRRSRSWCRGVALLTHAAQSAAPPAQRHQRSATSAAPCCAGPIGATHEVALGGPRQRHSPAIGPSRRVRRQPCYAHTKPFSLATGGVQCHVRSGLPTKRRCVRRNPAAQRAASLAQLTLHAAAQVAEILKDYADDEMGDRRQVCASPRLAPRYPVPLAPHTRNAHGRSSCSSASTWTARPSSGCSTAASSRRTSSLLTTSTGTRSLRRPTAPPEHRATPRHIVRSARDHPVPNRSGAACGTSARAAHSRGLDMLWVAPSAVEMCVTTRLRKFVGARVTFERPRGAGCPWDCGLRIRFRKKSYNWP